MYDLHDLRANFPGLDTYYDTDAAQHARIYLYHDGRLGSRLSSYTKYLVNK